MIHSKPPLCFTASHETRIPCFTRHPRSTATNSFFVILPLQRNSARCNKAVQQAHNTLEDLLLPSSIIIDCITKYLEENNIKYVSHNDKRTEQTFTIEGKQYILDNENHLKNIYLIMLDMKNQSTLKHAINRHPNTLTNLQTSLQEHIIDFQYSITNKLDYQVLIKLITRVLSLMVNNSIQTKKM